MENWLACRIFAYYISYIDTIFLFTSLTLRRFHSRLSSDWYTINICNNFSWRNIAVNPRTWSEEGNR